MDTAGSQCAACLYDGAARRMLAQHSETIDRGHAERLMGIISEVMGSAGAGYGDLAKIITSTGPGSFTGIRVTVATAKGFGLGLGIPVIGISTLAAMLATVREKAPGDGGAGFGALIDARRGEVHGLLDFETPLAAAETPFAADLAGFAGLLEERLASDPAGRLVLGIQEIGQGAGSDAGTIEARIAQSAFADRIDVLPIAAVPIRLYAELGAAADQATHLAEPLYLRPPDAKPQTGFAVKRI